MINDETLVLYYGDELDEDERRVLALQLQSDPALAHRYTRLVADMDRLRNMPGPVAPTAATSAWHSALRVAATPVQARPVQWWTPMLAAAAALGVLAIGIAIGMRVGDGPAPAPQIAERGEATPDTALPARLQASPAFSRGLASYMQSARVRLDDLPAASDSERAAVLAGIIANNRAFEKAAVDNGAEDIARVLRAFEQVLVHLAQPAGSPAEFHRELEQLTFEFGAMLTRIAPQASKQPYTL